MITVTVELSLDTAAKLAHRASEHKRAVIDEALHSDNRRRLSGLVALFFNLLNRAFLYC